MYVYKYNLYICIHGINEKFRNMLNSRQLGSVGKDTCHQAWCFEFDPLPYMKEEDTLTYYHAVFRYLDMCAHTH